MKNAITIKTNQKVVTKPRALPGKKPLTTKQKRYLAAKLNK